MPFIRLQADHKKKMEVKKMQQRNKKTFRDKLKLGFSKRKTQSLDEGYGFDIGAAQGMRNEQKHIESLNDKSFTQPRSCQRAYVRNMSESGSIYDKIIRQSSADKNDIKNALVRG